MKQIRNWFNYKPTMIPVKLRTGIIGGIVCYILLSAWWMKEMYGAIDSILGLFVINIIYGTPILVGLSAVGGLMIAIITGICQVLMGVNHTDTADLPHDKRKPSFIKRVLFVGTMVSAFAFALFWWLADKATYRTVEYGIFWVLWIMIIIVAYLAISRRKSNTKGTGK